jgi:hypothetical protein
LDGADTAGTGVQPANGATVSTWVDKSNNSNNATGGTSPTYSTSGKGLVFSTASATYLQTAITAVPTAETVLCVFTPTNAQLSLNNDMFSSSATNGLGFQIIGNGTSFALKYDIWGITGYAFTSYTIFPGTIALGSGTFSSSTATTFLNGGASVGGPTGGVSPSGSGTRRVGSGVGGDYFNGTIHELIYYNSALTTSERQQVEGYLAHKWGLSLSIPSIHPFYSIRPHLRTFQPIDVPGCQLWLDAADQSSMTLSGSSVTQWRDKSGNGLNVSAASSQPTYVTNGLNGLGTLAFNGSQGLSAGSVTGERLLGSGVSSATFCVFSVSNSSQPSCPITWDDSGYTYRFMITLEGSQGLNFDLGDINQGQRRINIPTSSITFANNTYYLVSFWKNGSNVVLNVNGGTFTASSSTFAGNWSTSASRLLNIGTYINTSTYNMKGNIAEILVYNTHIPSNFKQVEGYLAHKWGLSLYLPVISPLSIPGCQLWLDAADSSTISFSSGSNVSVWTNKGIVSTTATPTRGATANQITYVTVDGYPGVYINNNGSIEYNASTYSQLTVQSNFQDTADYSIFAVVNLSNITSGSLQTIYGNERETSGEKRGPNFGAGQSFEFNAVGASRVIDLSFIGSGRLQTALISSSSALTAYTNATAYGSNTNGLTRFSTDAGPLPRIGGAFGSINDPRFATGYFHEVIFYNSVLTTTQRQQVEGYLARKWGLSIGTTLPSPHPFKSFPPAIAAHFYPTYISGCQLWLDAADSSAITIGTGVSQWTDKSGNAYNLTQSTTGSQPTYASSLVTFANDKYLNIPASVMNNLSTWSLFFVINPISASNWIMSKQKDLVDTYNVLSMTYNTSTAGAAQTGTVASLYWRSMNAGTQAVSPEPLSTSTLQFYSLTYDGTNLYFYKNGELNQTTSGTFALQNQTSPNTYTLGALIYQGGQIINPGVTNFKLGEMIIYNTFLTNPQREKIEGYFADKWGLLSSLSSTHPYKPLPPIFPPTVQYNLTATGGTIVSTVGTTYHIFKSSSIFVVRTAVTVNYLVVGGGGGGGDRHGGGGGAGGVLSGTWSASAGTYTVTVGSGGQFGATAEGGQTTAYGSPAGAGTKGGNSLLSGTGISITAYGGGGGGTYDGNPSGTFGSGGGGGGQNLSGIAGTAGQGNAGGAGLLPGAGGGGGAGGAGVAANTGTGGIGTTSFSTHLLAVGYGTTFAVPTSPNIVISGGVAYIAGGGGGCAGTSPGPGGSGGLGGGGRGDWTDSFISAGTPNTGGGGGATRSDVGLLYSTGRNGGSGLVLLWY